MSGLRELDDRVVPRAAARLRALVDRTGGRRRAVTQRARDAVVAPPAPGLLRRLDDRFARRGPLGVVRDVPQVGVVVIATVFLAGAGVALARSGDDGPRRGGAAGTTAAAPQESRRLGPEVGALVPDYVAAAGQQAVAYSRERPDALHVALVSLTAYREPDEVRALLAGIEVQRAYLRVPSSDPSEVLSADVQDLVGDLRLLYAATAERKGDDQEEFLELARSIDAQNDEQTRFKEFYELSARLAGREATAYRTGCACLFSVVVRAPARVLAELPALEGVRAVELAPRGVALEELRVQPLGPEQTTTVAAAAEPRSGAGR